MAEIPGIISTDQENKLSNYQNQDFCNFVIRIIYKICKELGVNILKSECFEKDGRMALMIRADATEAKVDLLNFRKAMELTGKRINTIIRVQKEDLFRYMHRI